VSTTLRAIAATAPEIQLFVHQAAARLGTDPERIRRRKIEEQRQHELKAIRARLLPERVAQWRLEANRDWRWREDREVSEARQGRRKRPQRG
jgi:hypothetical protein